MTRLGALLSLAVLACGRTERIDSAPPPTHTSAGLQVPAACPPFAPGGGNVGSPFPPQVTALCAVDDAGSAYGLVQGDAPTAPPAVIPGGRELGIYFGFDPALMFSADRLTQQGLPTLQITTVSWSPSQIAPVTPAVVAQAPAGLLVSLGRFDTGPEEVVFYADLDAMFGAGGTFGETFYVNSAPP